MVDPERSAENAARINRELGESHQRAVDALCGPIVRNTVELIEEKLVEDATILGRVGVDQSVSLYTPGSEIEFYVSPDPTVIPMIGGRPKKALTIQFERRLEFGEGATDLGDKLLLSIPVREHYKYPAPLDPLDAAAERIYAEYRYAPERKIPSQRFIIQLEGTHYKILRYTTEYEGLSDFVKDAGNLTADELLLSFDTPISDEAEIATQVSRAMGNFRLVPMRTWAMNRDFRWEAKGPEAEN